MCGMNNMKILLSDFKKIQTDRQADIANAIDAFLQLVFSSSLKTDTTFVAKRGSASIRRPPRKV